MKNSRDGKSYSTNLAFTPPEYLRTGIHTLCFFVAQLLVYILCYKSVQMYYFYMKLVHCHTVIYSRLGKGWKCCAVVLL